MQNIYYSITESLLRFVSFFVAFVVFFCFVLFLQLLKMKIDLDSFVVFGAHLFVFYLLSAESNRNENENEKKAKLHDDDDYHIWVNYWLKEKR